MQQTGKGRAVQENAGELDSVDTCGSSLGWVQGGMGHTVLEGGEPNPLTMHSFLCALRSLSQGRSDQPLQLLHQGPIRNQQL